MPDLAPLLPLILTTHVTLAVALFVPGLLLPFTLRARPGREGEPGALVRALTWVQAHGSVVIGAGLALTGFAMVAVLGARIIGQPWLLLGLTVYAVTATVVLVIQRPALRRLRTGDRAVSDTARAAWQQRARQQRYIAYGVTGAVGLIGYLMSAKPELW